MDALLAFLHRMRIGATVGGLALTALLLGGLAFPAQAQHDPFHTPIIDSIIAAEDSIAAAEAADRAAADTSEGDQHAILRGLNALDDVLPPRLMVVLIVLGFMVLPLASALGFGAVALFSESGCLRMVLAVMGWGAALVGGLTTGGLLGSMLDGGWAFFIWTGVIVCGIGYLILYARAGAYIEQLPREERLTWKHTLTGAALLGTGASSAASLWRSAGALFRGGGGSFGGGGASGAFGGGQIAQVTAASAQGAGASGAAVLSSNVAPAVAGAASAGVVGARAAASANPGGASSIGSRVRRFGHALWGSLQRLRWYHGAAFVFIVLVFLPVGMGVGVISQRPRLLLWIAGVYTLWRVLLLFGRAMPEGNVSRAVGAIMFIVFFISPVLAAESGAPYGHLAIVGAIAGLVEIGLFVLPDNRPQAETPSTRAIPFRGGGASERW